MERGETGAEGERKRGQRKIESSKRHFLLNIANLISELDSEFDQGVMTIDQVHKKQQEFDHTTDKSLSYSRYWLKIKLQDNLRVFYTGENGGSQSQRWHRSHSREHHANLKHGNENTQILKTTQIIMK